MISNLGNKNLFFIKNNNDKKSSTIITEDIRAIKDKLAAGMKVDDLSDEEYGKLNMFEKAENAAFWQEITEEMSKAERIAVKVAKGEKLSEEEERFINEKYPDMKREAEQAKKEGEDLKERLKGAKSTKERQQIIAMAMSSVSEMALKGGISDIQLRIKIAAIEKAKEDSEKGDGEISIKNVNLKEGTLLNKLV
ncbi:alpha-NAC protein [Clostridium ihumii]|uniref:alpha-NAC protein n=1 Tax=Clostridium ihumii TaxID=1470356 RepID=UPI003D33F093